MIKIPLTRGKVTIIDDEDLELVSKYKWWAHEGKTTWYARAYLKLGKYNYTHIYLHRLLTRAEPDRQVDHRNGNGLDNRRSNLRLATSSHNLMNRRPTMNCSSKYKGVSWCNQKSKWRVCIQANQKQIHLGFFVDEIAAAKA